MLKILRYLYRWFWRLAFTFARPSVVRNAQPALSYAGLCFPGRLPVSGGNVKLRTLAQQFPPNEKAANLLYLVSSGINIRSEEWAEACLRQGIKLVWNQNGVGYPRWEPTHYRQINARMARLLHRASFVVYQSEFCRHMADRYLGVFHGLSAVVYNAVDTNIFVPPKEGRNPSHPLRLLVMGSYASPVRLMMSLKTIAALRQDGVDAVLEIRGRLYWPNAEAELRAAIVREGLADRVRFLGAYSHGDAPTILQGADILLHLQHGDACPSVVLEAMACGLPVVAPASGGIPELVGEAGALLPAPDAEDVFTLDISAVVRAVKAVAAGHVRIASAARQRAVEKFDTRLWLERHRDIFHEVLRKA